MVQPPPVAEQPYWIQDLWMGPTGAQHGEQGLMRSAARKFSRQLQNGLSMASQTCKERDFGGVSGGSSWSPSVVIEGRVTRKVGALTMEDGTATRFADMYVHDAVFGNDGIADEPVIATSPAGQRVVLPASASRPERQRVGILFEAFFDYIRSVNVYVQQYVCAAEELQNMDEETIQHTVLLVRGRRPINHGRDEPGGTAGRSAFAIAAGDHGRMRGMPELCVLCPRHLALDETCALVVNLRGPSGLQHIKIDHRAWDYLYHVLVYPTGEGGFEVGLQLRNRMDAYQSLPQGTVINYRNIPTSTAMNPRTDMSMLQYYAYRLHFRRAPVRSDNCIFMTDRLLQEYACVAFWRIESSRLMIHILRQNELRAARVFELRSFAAAQLAGNSPEAIGRVSYMPESFVGGPKDMYSSYQDAMAAVLHFGSPSLFITKTANPRWREVKASLAFGQRAEQRPDIIARVFHVKLNHLLKDLKLKFGTQVVCVHVIEFQKRGLPHAHIVVVLKEADRPRQGVDIDKMSSAELPPMPSDDDHSVEACTQRKVRELVLEHMVHNDCSGPEGRKCPCWDDVKKQCGGNFPFEYAQQTTVGTERTRVSLRRRHGPAWTATINGRRITNQWVVPYNAALLLKYECHLNVEVVTAAHAIKYLYKYLFKGADSASAAMHAVAKIVDQIGHYQDHRYLGASEAFWRLFQYKIHRMVHGGTTLGVTRMVVELPGQGYVGDPLNPMCVNHCTLTPCVIALCTESGITTRATKWRLHSGHKRTSISRRSCASARRLTVLVTLIKRGRHLQFQLSHRNIHGIVSLASGSEGHATRLALGVCMPYIQTRVIFSICEGCCAH